MWALPMNHRQGKLHWWRGQLMLTQLFLQELRPQLIYTVCTRTKNMFSSQHAVFNFSGTQFQESHLSSKVSSLYTEPRPAEAWKFKLKEIIVFGLKNLKSTRLLPLLFWSLHLHWGDLLSEWFQNPDSLYCVVLSMPHQGPFTCCL